MLGVFVIALCVAAAWLVGAVMPVFNLDAVAPSVPVIAAVYATQQRGVAAGLVAALIVGVLSTVSLGAGRGLELLSLLPVVLLTRAASFHLPLHRALPAAAWATASCYLASCLKAAFGLLLLPSVRLWPALLWVAPATALATGLTAFPLFLALHVLEPALRPKQERLLRWQA